MTYLTANSFFRFNSNLYSYFQVVTVKPIGGGNAEVTFADASTLTMTVAEAKDIFEVE